jgi:hypothetical protein
LKLSNQKIYSILLPSFFGWICSYLATNIYKDYTLGLFIWLPFVLGASSTLILSYKNTEDRNKLRNNAYVTLFTFSIGLLFFAWEGLICLVMALPIGFTSTYLGFLVAHLLTKNKLNSKTPTNVILLSLSVPALMSFEHAVKWKEDLRYIKSSIEIIGSPEAVWKNVIEFPQLKEPKEFIFKTGIAYPINATIAGEGVGAVRNCNFTTGCFVEPITIWDKPQTLQFLVEEQPEPMKEISIYDIHPTHLHGYWVSKKGQFKLTKLSSGHTLLEGTTWYVNKIKPDIYWTLWSDYIVHKIHNRVLEHIKEQTEKQTAKLMP